MAEPPSPTADFVAAQTNRAVSRPSRPTARAAISGSDQGLAWAASSCPRRSVARVREAEAIQKIIQVTRPTARMDSEPPMISWAWKLNPLGPKVSAAPKASDTPTARPTPSQINGSCRRRPVLTR